MRVLLLLLLAPINLVGQSASAALGGSQLLGLAGVQTEYQYNGRFGWTGIGYNNGLKIAGYHNSPLRIFTLEDTRRDKYRLGLGDQELDAGLATDEFDFNQVAVRGESILRHTKNSHLQVFVGKFSAQDIQLYLRSVYQLNPQFVGAVVGNTRLSKTLTLQSYNVIGSTSTSIQSFSFTPKPNWHLSTADGVGNHHPYLANAVEFQKNTLDLRASYTLADRNFHRQEGTYGIEPLGLNAKADIPLGEATTLRFSHRHELTVVPRYLGFKQDSSIGTVDFAGLTTSFFGFRASASATQSVSNRFVGKEYAGVASISRKIVPCWKSTFSYLNTALSSQNIVVFQNTNEFRVNNRLTLSQNIDWINGAFNNTFGGRWSSNWVSLSIDNQVYTSPVAAQFGQKSVFQAWNISVRFRTPHGTNTHLETLVDPFGKTQWGGYLTGLRYRGLSNYSGPEMQHVSFSRYVIRGKVEDEDGKGVWGVAINIGGETAISDSEGSFFLHVKDSKPMSLRVSTDASLQMAKWSLVSAPDTAQGAPEDAPALLRVVVQIGRLNRTIARAGSK